MIIFIQKLLSKETARILQDFFKNQLDPQKKKNTSNIFQNIPKDSETNPPLLAFMKEILSIKKELSLNEMLTSRKDLIPVLFAGF